MINWLDLTLRIYSSTHSILNTIRTSIWHLIKLVQQFAHVVPSLVARHDWIWLDWMNSIEMKRNELNLRINERWGKQQQQQQQQQEQQQQQQAQALEQRVREFRVELWDDRDRNTVVYGLLEQNTVTCCTGVVERTTAVRYGTVRYCDNLQNTVL